MKLLTSTAWQRLTQLTRRPDRGSALAAVPYLGRDAAIRLPLRAGDTLLTRFDDAAFSGGLGHLVRLGCQARGHLSFQKAPRSGWRSCLHILEDRVKGCARHLQVALDCAKSELR